MIEVANYLNKQGQVQHWPAKREGKAAVARYMAGKFETGRFYTEKEVNRIVEENHTFGDYFLLRREMVEHGAMLRTPDGARYWRGGLWPGAKPFSTDRLIIAATTEQDRREVGEIYFACGQVGEWAGEPHTEVTLTTMLDGTDLPPGGHSEFSHVVTLREKDGGAMVGFAQYYTAWPGPNSLWIGLFLLDPRHRQLGYGGECIGAMLAEARRQGYASAGLGVSLYNQPGLKFWVKCGFDRITKLKERADGALGLLALKMEL